MKLFRNCPKDERINCEGCPMLKHCIIKKMKRRIKRKIHNKKWIFKLFVFALIVILGIIIVKLNLKNNERKEELEQDKVNTIMTVRQEEIYCEKQKDAEVIQVVEKFEEQTEEKQEEITQEEETIKVEVNADQPNDEYYYSVTDEEKIALEKLVYKESRGEKLEGKVAVAAVVLNRYSSQDSASFDTSSILSVITQSSQFADISDVTQTQLESVPECKEAVDLALKGWDPTRKYFANGAKYFYEPNIVSGYEKQIREDLDVYEIGNHYFHENFNH